MFAKLKTKLYTVQCTVSIFLQLEVPPLVYNVTLLHSKLAEFEQQENLNLNLI